MATDPFQLASQYADSQNRMAYAENQNAQSALMAMFEMEARRQAPYAEMPAQLAAANIGGEAKLGRDMQLAQTKAALRRRYGKGKNGDKQQTVANGEAPAGWKYVQVGNEVVMIEDDGQ